MDKELTAFLEEMMRAKGEALAGELLQALAEGEREISLDAHVAWYLFTTLAERGPRHCQQN